MAEQKMPAPVVEGTHDFTFEVTITSFGRGDERHVVELAQILGIALNRMFGADRIQLRRDGKRYVLDPLAVDGEHVGHDTPLAVSDG